MDTDQHVLQRSHKNKIILRVNAIVSSSSGEKAVERHKVAQVEEKPVY